MFLVTNTLPEPKPPLSPKGLPSGPKPLFKSAIFNELAISSLLKSVLILNSYCLSAISLTNSLYLACLFKACTNAELEPSSLETLLFAETKEKSLISLFKLKLA